MILFVNNNLGILFLAGEEEEIIYQNILEIPPLHKIKMMNILEKITLKNSIQIE